MTAAGSAGEQKRSVTIAGHRTSVSLENEFWTALGEIARHRGISVSGLIAEIDEKRGNRGLSSALRVHILDHFRRTGPPADAPDGD